MNNQVIPFRVINLLLVFAFTTFGVERLSAQAKDKQVKGPEKITIGTIHEIESKILGEKRQFSVSTPLGYDEKEK